MGCVEFWILFGVVVELDVKIDSLMCFLCFLLS